MSAFATCAPDPERATFANDACLGWTAASSQSRGRACPTWSAGASWFRLYCVTSPSGSGCARNWRSVSSGFTVAAEGIESEEQLARVRAAGCDEWQGRLYSEPLEAEAFSALLTRAAYVASA
ncbi:MAG: EAL domain-containing protein [Betaproteobacteria bacterium]|nr:EAL domain-containing protein [Betaproteobacteria bacterium]